MFNTKYRFNQVDPSLDSSRVVFEFEKETLIDDFKKSNMKMYTISKDNIICKDLNAKVDDIICIKNHLVKKYRRVI